MLYWWQFSLPSQHWIYNEAAGSAICSLCWAERVGSSIGVLKARTIPEAFVCILLVKVLRLKNESSSESISDTQFIGCHTNINSLFGASVSHSDKFLLWSLFLMWTCFFVLGQGLGYLRRFSSVEAANFIKFARSCNCRHYSEKQPKFCCLVTFDIIVKYTHTNVTDRKSTRLNSSHVKRSRMPSSAWKKKQTKKSKLTH